MSPGEAFEKMYKVIEEYQQKGISIPQLPNGDYHIEHPSISFTLTIKDEKIVGIKI